MYTCVPHLYEQDRPSETPGFWDQRQSLEQAKLDGGSVGLGIASENLDIHKPMGPDGFHLQDKRQWAQIKTCEMPSEHKALHFFAGKVVKHLNRLSIEVVESPSLETFNTQLHMVLGQPALANPAWARTSD